MPTDPAAAREVFLAAVEIPAQERAAYLVSACGTDVDLRLRVAALLQAHDAQTPATGDFPPRSAASQADGGTTGERIGPYKLLQKLGEGGMGTVWLAEQSEPVRRKVAVKVIKAGMDSALVVARFEAERQALALMDHPNIAKILDAGTTSTGRPYFVMELVKGIAITKYCDQEHLTPTERLQLFIPVCQAVQHAHQKGIIHRDIKPSNIMVGLYDGRPVPKIIDFGVAKATSQQLTDRSLFTEIGNIIGTLEYMAPEQAELNNLDIDTRADIYSLGVVLYELLAGEPPFASKQLRGAAFSEMLRIIREVEPSKPSTKLSSSDELPNIAANRKSEPKRLAKIMHGDLDWIVMKCLEKDRGRRYETANGLALELQRFIAHEPVLAGPPARRYRIKKFLRRHQAATTAACVLLLALLLGISGTTWGLLRARSERDAKELARVDAENRRAEADQQRQRADQQAAIATAVNDFLCNDLLRQSDSVAQAGRGFAEDPNLTVKTALQRAGDRIGDRFSKDPMVEAAVRMAIGEAFAGVGDARQAIGHLERTAALRLSGLGADHADTLAARFNLAGAYMNAGRVTEAWPIFADVVERRTRNLGSDHRDTLIARYHLADAHRTAGRHNEAIKIDEEVAERATALFGRDDPVTLVTLNNLGVNYSFAGRGADAVRICSEVVELRKVKVGAAHLDTIISTHNLARANLAAGQVVEAVRLHEQVCDALTAKLGPDHPQTLIGLNGLGWAYQQTGQLQRAAETYERVRDVQNPKLGPDHPDTLYTLHNLAGIYRALGRFAEGVKLQEHVRDRMSVILGPDHPNTIVALSQLGAAYQMVDRFDDAINTLKRVCEIQSTKLGPNHDDTLIPLHNLAMTYRSAGRIDEAIAIHERVRDAYVAKYGPDHPNTMIGTNMLAMAYLDKGRQAEAITLFEQVVKRQADKFGENHPDPLISNHNLAMAYIRADRTAEAISRLEDALPRFRTTYTADHQNTLTCTSTLGDAYIKAGRFADAEKLLRDSLVLRAKALADHWSTANAQSLLGESIMGLERYTDAEPLLIQGYEGLKRQTGAVLDAHQSKRLKEAIGRLVRLYDAWGKPDDAAKWRKALATVMTSSDPAKP